MGPSSHRNLPLRGRLLEAILLGAWGLAGCASSAPPSANPPASPATASAPATATASPAAPAAPGIPSAAEAPGPPPLAPAGGPERNPGPPEPPPRPPDELDALIRQLGDPAWPKREEASRQLSALGEAALPALRKALDHDDSEIRARASTLIDTIRLGITPELRAKVGNLLDGFNALPADDKRRILERLVRQAGTAALPALDRILRIEGDETILNDAFRWLNQLDPDAARRALERLARGPSARPWHVETFGRLLARQGDLQGSIAAFEAALARGIDRAPLRLAYAETLLWADLKARALPVLERLETEEAVPSDDRSRLRFWLAEALVATGRFADALPRYAAFARDATLLEDSGNDRQMEQFYDAALRMGDCLRRLDRSGEIEARWMELLGPAAQTPVGRLRLAELLRRGGLTERAHAIARDVLAATKADDIPLRSRGALLLAHAGRYADALAVYRDLKLNDRLAYPHQVELLLRLTGRPEDALRVRMADLAPRPDEVASYLVAAASAERAELFELAIEQLQMACRQFSTFDAPQHHLAGLLARLGRYDEALALNAIPPAVALRCHEALGHIDAGIALGEQELERRVDARAPRARRKPGLDLQAAAALARLYRRKGIPAKGIPVLKEANSATFEDEGPFEFFFELGRQHEEAGEPAEAILTYLTAWRLSALRSMDVQEARRRAGYLAAQSQEAARQALDAFRRRAAGRPGAPPVPLGLVARVPAGAVAAGILEAELLALAGDTAQAAAACERADTALPRRPDTGCRAARFLARAGDADGARRRLERVAAEWPDDPTAYYELERLAREAGRDEEAKRFAARAAAAGALDK
jgi:predicted Zn-dependent protease